MKTYKKLLVPKKSEWNRNTLFYITPPKNPQIFSLWDERWLIKTNI